jgi:hypothetical protein
MREVAWLYAELPGLVERGVLSPEAADALRRHYGSPTLERRAVGWGQILLASFGALLVGGGIILILAHNWDELGRPARAAIALGLLIIAQGLTLYAVVRRSESAAWREATSGFLVVAVGAAISLIGQTYHVGGSFEGLMQAWLWLVVLIPYISGSGLAAILFWALLLVRIMSHSWHDAPADPWALVFAGLPFVVFLLRRQPASWLTALVATAAAVSMFVTGSIFTAGAGWSGLWSVFQISLLAAIVAAASWPPGLDTAEPWRRRLLVPAWFALIVVGTILTFDDAWRTVTLGERALDSPSVVVSAAVAVACAVFASVMTVRLARAGRIAAAVAASAAVLVVTMHGLTMLEVHAGWIVLNLWLLTLGIVTLAEGVRLPRLATVNLGLLALAGLIVARFFDTDLSFLVRGLIFVSFGVTCLLINLWFMRRVQKGTS